MKKLLALLIIGGLLGLTTGCPPATSTPKAGGGAKPSAGKDMKDAKHKEDEAKKKEEEAKHKEDEAKKAGDVKKQKEGEAKQKEDEAKKKEDEAKKKAGGK